MHLSLVLRTYFYCMVIIVLATIRSLTGELSSGGVMGCALGLSHVLMHCASFARYRSWVRPITSGDLWRDLAVGHVQLLSPIRCCHKRCQIEKRQIPQLRQFHHHLQNTSLMLEQIQRLVDSLLNKTEMFHSLRVHLCICF